MTWIYEGQDYNDDLAEFYRRYDMNSLLKKNVSCLHEDQNRSKPLDV